MDWECPHCHKLFNFSKHQQKGAHITNCRANPKHAAIGAAISAANTEPRIELIKNCKKCSKNFTQFRTAREIETGKNVADFCSRYCANSHVVSDAHREKVSKTMKDKFSQGELELPPNRFGSPGGYIKDRIREQRNCLTCGTQFECRPSSKKRTCSKKCSNKLMSKILKNTGKTGGYRTKSGTSKFHGSYYNGIWMDSSWEIALATRLDELGIIWERDNKRFFNYIDIDGNPRKYYPDFYLPAHDLYLECKGYWTPKVKHKMQDVQARNSFQLMILEDIKLIRSFNI
jgi:hypothetical protein